MQNFCISLGGTYSEDLTPHLRRDDPQPEPRNVRTRRTDRSSGSGSTAATADQPNISDSSNNYLDDR
jgi:hypothetical protein